jgi:tetratricopeptide (TPR) repeat protein
MTNRFLALLILLFCQMPAFGVQDFAVTREELALMPPYCTAYYGHLFGLPPLQESPLRSTVPDGCPALHHYCDGLKSMIRADRNDKESGYWLGVAAQAFQSMARREDWASCPLRPEAYMNLGKALLRQSQRGQGSSAEAAANFMKALELNPDYLPAYYALSDYYIDLGNKKKALGVVEDGLRRLPDSKGLLRRFKELGGKTPPEPIAATAKPDTPQTVNTAPTQQQQQTPAETGAAPANEGAAPAEQDTAPEQSTEEKIGSPTNPWCRFCPPE